MRAILDLVLGRLGRVECLLLRIAVLVAPGRFRGLETEGCGGCVEETLLDAVEGALGEDVDTVDYVVDQTLRYPRYELVWIGFGVLETNIQGY